MKVCRRCGLPISGEADETIPFSTSGARPTVHHHKTLAECRSAQDDAGKPPERTRRPA
ncbi:hypothetical protein GCM10017667_26160 [Streptomyces filamentosus]|uniref:Uncharacterized protein n=1 Tax=Streptomyces filamentosus TaxID=67294 RepID=A0A919ELI6_STRFL|nr:hypothetical protein GCM10017667_26160 [Streptomyces filamentosus]